MPFSCQSVNELNPIIGGKLIHCHCRCSSIQLYGRVFSLNENISNCYLISLTKEKSSVCSVLLICNKLFGFSAPSKLQMDVEEKAAIKKPLNKVSANVDLNRPFKEEINILLLGVTGVGKSTLINALVNYLVNDTLEQAVNNRIEVLIPFSIAHMNETTFEEKWISYGEKDEYEQIGVTGGSCTRKCRSFVFRVGDQLLRFIDTPSVDDTRGFEHDIQNLDEIMNYIARYKYLHGICLLLRSNEERLHFFYRYCLLEFLRHLPKNAVENIIWVLTMSRSTFFMMGSMSNVLKDLLNEWRGFNDINIPFQKTNSFLVDNESFRYLAFHRCGIQRNDKDVIEYSKSWNHTVQELVRLLSYTIDRRACAVRHIVSFYQVQRFISILAHSIYQMPHDIQEVIQQTEKYKKRNPKISYIASQHGIQITSINPPHLVCTNPKCVEIMYVNGSPTIRYKSICYERSCFTDNVVGNKNNPNIRNCAVMDPKTGTVFNLFLAYRLSRVDSCYNFLFRLL